MSGSAAAVEDGALQGWMAAWGAELGAHLRRFVGSDDAEDLLQEVWIKAHRRPPDDGEGANVRAWLYRVATRAALDHLERAGRRRRLLEARGHGLEPAPAAPADPAVADERRRRVREAVARLPRKQREAVWARWVDGLSYEAVAERLACSPGSARANVYLGLKRLRGELSELLSEEDR